MNRRRLLHVSSAAALAAALPTAPPARAAEPPADPGNAPLHPPEHGDIPVAFLLSDSAVVIDVAGPWEVFQDVSIPGRPNPFRLYTVAESLAPIHASGGMLLLPNHTLAAAPMPKVLVIPAQAPPTQAVIDWIRRVAAEADLVMSVCSGAFLLARTGLLDGRAATTHHGDYDALALDFPEIDVRRGARFVDLGRIASSGGLSSGIDLALHVVERYFGHAAAAATADMMEYQGLGWTNPAANRAYAARPASTPEHPRCAVCGMDVDSATALRSRYRTRLYYFCGQPHRILFAAHPDRFAIML